MLKDTNVSYLSCLASGKLYKKNMNMLFLSLIIEK